MDLSLHAQQNERNTESSKALSLGEMVKFTLLGYIRKCVRKGHNYFHTLDRNVAPFFFYTFPYYFYKVNHPVYRIVDLQLWVYCTVYNYKTTPRPRSFVPQTRLRPPRGKHGPSCVDIVRMRFARPRCSPLHARSYAFRSFKISDLDLAARNRGT